MKDLWSWASLRHRETAALSFDRDLENYSLMSGNGTLYVICVHYQEWKSAFQIRLGYSNA